VDNAEVEMLGQPHFDLEAGNEVESSHTDGMPILRIGLIENRDSIEFRLTGRFSVFNDQGVSILKDVASSVKWRVKIEQYSPAKYFYNVLLGKFQDRQAARDLEYILIEKGIGTRIKVRGGKLYYNDRVVNDNTQYWVVVDVLNSEQEALSFAKQNLAQFSYQVIKQKVNEPHALFELFDSEFEKLGEAESVIRIVPEAHDVVTYIYDSILENELGNRPVKFRAVKGPLEFRCTNDGKIIIICEMALEKYVESIVALEVKPDFPVEAIQAQAIAVRSKTIASLGIKHYEDMFHLCSGSHCQVFNGFIQTPGVISNAVKQTMGLVLRDDRHAIDANTSLVCGGHTEAYQVLNKEGFGDPYPAVFDGRNENYKKQPFNLNDKEDLNRWICEEPDVYCNLNHQQAGNAAHHFRKQFRWQVSYDRHELEEIISTKVGSDIGNLYDIIPIRRGVSGRILEIEILASNKNIVLCGEDKIRQLLANERLPSSCLVIKRQFDDNGFPLSFTFHGAGSGHGVGLCQAGAIAMANQGKRHPEILAHYFKGTHLKKIY
jgi:stage II sporulation protein D